MGSESPLFLFFLCTQCITFMKRTALSCLCSDALRAVAMELQDYVERQAMYFGFISAASFTASQMCTKNESAP
jgi:hypothetical protein